MKWMIMDAVRLSASLLTAPGAPSSKKGFKDRGVRRCCTSLSAQRRGALYACGLPLRPLAGCELRRACRT